MDVTLKYSCQHGFFLFVFSFNMHVLYCVHNGQIFKNVGKTDNCFVYKKTNTLHVFDLCNVKRLLGGHKN